MATTTLTTGLARLTVYVIFNFDSNPLRPFLYNDSTFAVREPNEDLTRLRLLWWKEGNFIQKPKWEEVTLPYVLAEGVSLDEFESRTDEFNAHGLWEWANFEVSVYELSLKPHEICIGAINKEFNECCRGANRTNATIIGTRADDSGKEEDLSFRPMKPRVPTLTGKSENYWLKDYSRAHDAIVVKIDPVSVGEIPSRMQ
ncbi:6353_t:CDS:2, partial [Diversispora eburnea]